MAKKNFKVGGEPAGLEWLGGQLQRPVEEGEEVEVDLGADTERALVAAGWVVPVKKKEEK